MVENNTPKDNIEEIVETYVLITDPITGLDERYIPVKVAQEEAKNYPRIIYHDLSK